jgi:drug/metabolite transporter (DMT)-like permease
MKESVQAKLMLSAAMVIFGTLGVFTRNIGVTSGELALYRAVLASVLIVVYLVFIKKGGLNLKNAGRELPLLLASGIAMGINWILLFQAYRYTTISAATLSYYFAPVIVTVASPLLFHERLTAKQIICFVMSTLGLVLIIGTGGGEETAGITGILFGMGAAVFYAAVILLNKFIKNVAGIQRTILQMLAAVVTLLPYVAVSSGFNLNLLDGTGWACLLTVGLFHTGITYCLYFSALKDLTGQEAAILSYIDPLVAVIISVLLLGEPMTLMQLIGGALILGFTLWNEKA